MQAREREKRSVREKVVPSSPHKPPVCQHRAWVQTHPGRYLPISLNDAISVDSDCDDFYFVLFIQITPAA